jgi:hypothetical protein
MEATAMSNDIKLKNPIKEREEGNPEFNNPPELGDESHADEVTSANEELQVAHGDDSTPEANETLLDNISGQAHSVDEHMSAGSESPEDKVTDIINSGILRI